MTKFHNTTCLENEELNEPNLADKSLNDLTCDVETTKSTQKTEEFLHYNRSARKMIRKHLSKMKKSKNKNVDTNDTNDEYKNISWRSFTSHYTKSPQILTRCKVYSLLYLGLLIVKDKIQLSDMLRYVQSYFWYFLKKLLIW